ncbi:MAG: response regulator, partial [Ruminococcus flavefaciens]|nr:response regulator [Ruminococcus flavefaciens]
MQIAVCDDEKEIRELFAEKIGKLYRGADLSLYQSGEELLLSDREPDILLLDIQMAGKNGMETAKELRKRNKKTIIIFVTALDDFVFQAF